MPRYKMFTYIHNDTSIDNHFVMRSMYGWISYFAWQWWQADPEENNVQFLADSTHKAACWWKMSVVAGWLECKCHVMTVTEKLVATFPFEVYTLKSRGHSHRIWRQQNFEVCGPLLSLSQSRNLSVFMQAFQPPRNPSARTSHMNVPKQHELENG